MVRQIRKSHYNAMYSTFLQGLAQNVMGMQKGQDPQRYPQRGDN